MRKFALFINFILTILICTFILNSLDILSCQKSHFNSSSILSVSSSLSSNKFDENKFISILIQTIVIFSVCIAFNITILICLMLHRHQENKRLNKFNRVSIALLTFAEIVASITLLSTLANYLIITYSHIPTIVLVLVSLFIELVTINIFHFIAQIFDIIQSSTLSSPMSNKNKRKLIFISSINIIIKIIIFFIDTLLIINCFIYTTMFIYINTLSFIRQCAF